MKASQQLHIVHLSLRFFSQNVGFLRESANGISTWGNGGVGLAFPGWCVMQIKVVGSFRRWKCSITSLVCCRGSLILVVGSSGEGARGGIPRLWCVDGG
jgi:hypothetical protein